MRYVLISANFEQHFRQVVKLFAEALSQTNDLDAMSLSHYRSDEGYKAFV